MKYLSLFSGIGGFELGIGDKAECVGYSEIDKYAIQIYEKHFPNHKNYGDITGIIVSELPYFDLLVGGFPCQAFSIAGKRRGFADTRGTLFFDIAKILQQKQPRLLVLENVKGLLSHDNGATFSTIISTLDELGYDLQWQVLNSKNFGVPQNRERVFIIGHLRGTPRPEVFPFRSDDKKNIELPRHVSNTLTARYEGAQATGTYIGEGKFNAQEINQINNPKHSNDRVYGDDGISPTLNTMQGGMRQRKVMRQPLKFLDRNQKNIEGDYSFTVDSMNTGGLRDGMKIRRLTPTECERLQGFPDDWTKYGLLKLMQNYTYMKKDDYTITVGCKIEGISDTQRYKCLGNAVTVNVVREIIKKLSTVFPHQHY